MFYADQFYSEKRLKSKLRSEISQLRHCLAKLECASLVVADKPLYSEGDARVVKIYRNMIQQRQKLYRSLHMKVRS